jgi:murein DD-endopeptidase MepM/ murein hydrolase activator NlpD
MFRAARAHLPPDMPARAAATLLGVLLLLTVEGALPRAAEADIPGSVVAIRQRQLQAERSMRRADRQIVRLERQRSATSHRFRRAARQLERAIERRDATRERGTLARTQLAVARDDRDCQLRVHPSPSGHQIADKAQLRKRVRALEARVDRLDDRARQWSRSVERAREVKQARARHGVGPRVAARRQARERAESVLSGQISLMLSIARDRSAARFAPSSTRRLLRPARGYVSQGYGCQARRHGHCLRFHDGIDIAAPVGTRVRAAADGYVAYAGWNPWDRGRRSWIVIIGHAEGLESIYGHLRPVRAVKAGQPVRRGQLIGYIGLTGHTSGPHVHWEVSRGFRTRDPRPGGR